MHLVLPRSHRWDRGVTWRTVYTPGSPHPWPREVQCETSSWTDALIQDEHERIRELGGHLALKKCDAEVPNYHLVRFDIFLQ